MIGSAKVEKRNRPPKSCEPCRTRKRNKQSLCQYATNADRQDKRAEKNESVADRLKNLESLIATVAQKSSKNDELFSHTINESPRPTEHRMPGNDNAFQPSNTAISDPTTDTTGSTAGLMGQVDSSHWSSILDNIRAIREELPAASPQTSMLSSVTLNNDLSTSEADFDLGSAEGYTIQHILSALPPRQYESFWDSPSETPSVWVALLFSLLSLSAGIYEISGMARTSQIPIPSSKALSKKTQECLLLINYAAAKEHVVEAFLLLLVGRWLRAKVSDTNLWFLMGKVVQLAICKGYHRESTKVPGSKISPFDGEMRRRVWVCLYQLDSLMSFQMGLPSMIPSGCCDTELPRNLNQSDFYPGIPELPPSRPLSENTTILYSIVKASVMAMFKKVVKHTRSLTPPSYDETLALDTEVRTAYDNIPDNFKYKPLTSFIVDDFSIIMSRTTIELLHLKSIIVLHRQHLTHRQDGSSFFSRNASLEAAERLLERQAEMHQVTQPGGLLYDMKWMIGSLTLSDFTLAAMVICLDLTVTMKHEFGFRSPNEEVDFRKKLVAIERAHGIWSSSSDTSEGRVVAHALESTIQRVNEYISSRPQMSAPQHWPTSATSAETSSYLMHDAAEPMSDFDMIDSIDWSLLDNQIQDANSIPDFDLDMWLVDTAGPLGPVESL
ncbi:hypothetical protein FBEOM_498 [Fusarium beomiforme]|uniref:Xylanolytic transcriptional activator regulatory domain-containing protein n=1 Tax=Fusarium beomiforme TaxID=44412 RepID=A0A9P5AVM0_9HYPO|nr:hypothetical protein FBEOM_498 [Fusarium beomiforme]